MSIPRRYGFKTMLVALVLILSTLSCGLPSMIQETDTPLPPVIPPTISAQTRSPLPTDSLPSIPTKTFTAPPPTATSRPTNTATPVPVIQVMTASNIAGVKATAKWGAGAIRKVDLSPDETKLLVASAQGLYLFEASDLKLLWKAIPGFAFRDAAFSPDGKMIAAVGDDTGVYLWDTATGKEIKTLFGHSDFLYAVDFSSTGRLASAGADNMIFLWDITTGNPLRKISAHTDRVNSIRFTGDGKFLVSGSADMFVKVWDVEKGSMLRAMDGHMTEIYSVDVAPAGDVAVSSSSSGEIFVWDIAKGARKFNMKPTQSTTDVRISEDGMRFAAGFENGTITIYNLGTGTKEIDLVGHTSLVRSMRFTTREKKLVSGSWDGTVLIWDIPGKSIVGDITGYSAYIQDLALAKAAPVLVAAVGNQVRIFNATTLKLEKTIVAPDIFVDCVAVTKDGKLAASAGSSDISLWDVASGKEKARLKGHIKYVSDLVFSPDDRYLASTGEDQVIIVWDVASGQSVVKWTGYPSEIYSLVFTPDGKSLLAGGRTEAVFSYSMATNKKERELWVGDDSIYEMLFLPNGNLVGASFGKVWVADFATGKQVKLLTGLAQQVNGLALSPDGSLLAVGDYEGKVVFFDTATWQPVKTLTEHWGMVWEVVFSADGKNFYSSGGGDGSIILWNVK